MVTSTPGSIGRSSTYWLIVSVLLCLTVLAFLYGVAVARYKMFPFNHLRDAKQAVQSLWSIWNEQDMTALPARSLGSGVTIRIGGRYQPGYSFVTGYKNGQLGAWLMDDQGTLLHQWHVRYSEVWPKAPHLLYQAKDQYIIVHGAHLFPNGDLVFNFDANNFPSGGGTVRLDKDSQVKWKLERNTHHDLDVMPDGTMYIAAHVLHLEADARFPQQRAPFYEDVVYVLDADGRIVRTISMLEAIANSPFAGLLTLTYEESHDIESEDPLHLNNVEVLREEKASAFPMFSAGDILVSFRHINTIAVIDGRSGLVKWAITGMFVRQHDPDFLSTGRILLFDNQGGDSRKGRSRILEIDPSDRAIIWKYEGTEDHQFFTTNMGKQERLANGNTLIVESRGGRVFEVDRQGEIVWEYVNANAGYGGNEQTLGVVTEADRLPYDYATFLK